HLGHSQADQLGVGHLRRATWAAATRAMCGDEPGGAFHIQCDEKGVQVGDHEAPPRSAVCEHADPGHSSASTPTSYNPPRITGQRSSCSCRSAAICYPRVRPAGAGACCCSSAPHKRDFEEGHPPCPNTSLPPRPGGGRGGGPPAARAPPGGSRPCCTATAWTRCT